MLKHIVLLSLHADYDAAELEGARVLLAGLVGKIDGMLDFAWGINRDYESRSANYQTGFVITFASRTAHLAYETHPDHVRVGSLLVAACSGGANGIFVADLETD